MKDVVRIGLLTLVVFAAGLFAGIWTQRLRPLPPPTMPPLGEMSRFHHDDHRHEGKEDGKGGWDRKDHFPFPPEKAEEMKAAMARIEPQIKAFEEKLGAMETDFRAKFEATLTPEQKKQFEEKAPPPFNAPGGPSNRMMGPLGGIAFFTIIAPGLEHMSKDLALTPDQQAKLKALLIERRQKFLDLVDTTPPPSLELGHMGPPPDH